MLRLTPVAGCVSRRLWRGAICVVDPCSCPLSLQGNYLLPKAGLGETTPYLFAVPAPCALHHQSWHWGDGNQSCRWDSIVIDIAIQGVEGR